MGNQNSKLINTDAADIATAGPATTRIDSAAGTRTVRSATALARKPPMTRINSGGTRTIQSANAITTISFTSVTTIINIGGATMTIDSPFGSDGRNYVDLDWDERLELRKPFLAYKKKVKEPFDWFDLMAHLDQVDHNLARAFSDVV